MINNSQIFLALKENLDVLEYFVGTNPEPLHFILLYPDSTTIFRYAFIHQICQIIPLKEI